MRSEIPGRDYDVLVIGGGMVGASFALDLAQRVNDQRFSIAVTEAMAIGDEACQPSFDARSTALAWGSRSIYQAMGLWSQLEPMVTPIRQIQVSDRGQFGVTRMHHDEHKVDALGYVVENRQLGGMLNKALLASADIDFMAPATIRSAVPRAESMNIEIDLAGQIQHLSARLVVLADGGRSPLCQQLGIEHKRKTYNQSALIANIGVDQPHHNVAYERFTGSGPLAMLPLQVYAGQSRYSLVWTVKSGDEQALVSCSEKEFLQRLSEHVGNRSGHLLRVGQRFTYPLTLTEAREQVRPHLVLLGNVAHILHPVAGQGLNLALRDSACLSKTLVEAVRLGRSPGSMGVLQQYLDQQVPDQRQTMLFTDQLIRLFSSTRFERVMARKVGLLGLDLLPVLRQEFSRRAMGM